MKQPMSRAASAMTIPAAGFGNNLGAGSSDTLFFTSGLGDEEHGLFGAIEAH